MEVRAVRGGEGGRLRELRLRSLRDAPDAFASRPEHEETYAPDAWEQVGRGVLVAEEAGEWQSELVYALLEAQWRAAQSQSRRRK